MPSKFAVLFEKIDERLGLNIEHLHRKGTVDHKVPVHLRKVQSVEMIRLLSKRSRFSRGPIMAFTVRVCSPLLARERERGPEERLCSLIPRWWGSFVNLDRLFQVQFSGPWHRTITRLIVIEPLVLVLETHCSAQAQPPFLLPQPLRFFSFDFTPTNF